MRHPMLLQGKYTLTKLIIRSEEHLRLLHAGPTLVESSLSRRYYILGERRVIHAITCSCMVCWQVAARPHLQLHMYLVNCQLIDLTLEQYLRKLELTMLVQF